MPASSLDRLLLRPTRSAVIANLVLLIASGYWHYNVNATVPEPYLDEVFHVRQAEAYWRGQWHIWDPKITTPPGLYLISYIYLHLLHIQGRLSNITLGLRSINFVAANVLIFVLVRSLLRKIRHGRESGRTSGQRRTKQILQSSEYELDHVTLNTCLFPPLFFFYGLYYTDVLSVGSVLLAYYFFLTRQTTGLLGAGLLSLLFRQTNIFWIAVFLGGLEVSRSLGRAFTYRPTWGEAMGGCSEKTRYYDPLVSEAYFEDYIKSACSIAICSLVNLRSVLGTLIPYLTFLGVFAAFIIWNGGVVLGDKANHVASLHLTQMLYIWPYILFFSFPILHHYFLHWIIPSGSLPRSVRYPYAKQTLPRLIITVPVLASMLAIVHFNTLIHPFTLADNRHYVFYVFRILLRHPVLKYLAVPIYFLCACAAITALSGPPVPQSSNKGSVPTVKREGKAMSSTAQGSAVEGNRVSFVLIWLGATALSLISAPLVEPRYLIVPWLIWRLHLPSLRPSPQGHAGRNSSNRKSRSFQARVKAWFYKEHDYRLWLETVWFLAVNWTTGYVFLYWGFRWAQEPGQVQRFMW